MIRNAPILAIALALRAAPVAAEPAEEELVRLERQLVAAIAAQDLAAYDRLVADDYVVVRAAGGFDTKADVLQRYRSGTFGYRDLAIDEVSARVFGDTGVVSARTSGFRREGGTEVPNRVRYVRVFARRGGSWRAVAQMSTPLPASP